MCRLLWKIENWVGAVWIASFFSLFIIFHPFHLRLYVSVQWAIAWASTKSIYILSIFSSIFRVSWFLRSWNSISIAKPQEKLIRWDWIFGKEIIKRNNRRMQFLYELHLIHELHFYSSCIWNKKSLQKMRFSQFNSTLEHRVSSTILNSLLMAHVEIYNVCFFFFR